MSNSKLKLENWVKITHTPDKFRCTSHTLEYYQLAISDLYALQRPLNNLLYLILLDYLRKLRLDKSSIQYAFVYQPRLRKGMFTEVAPVSSLLACSAFV